MGINQLATPGEGKKSGKIKVEERKKKEGK